MKETLAPGALSLIKWACCLELLGKSYQHFFFPPLYSQIWSTASESFLSALPAICGLIFACCGISILWVSIDRGWVKWPLAIATILLVMLAWTKFVASGYQIPQLLELELQSSLPVLIWLWVYEKNPRLSWFLFRLAIAFTFLGHGWYAAGFYYPVPNHFITMTVNSLGILGMTETGARIFLLLAGSMDLIVAISLFVPRLVRPASGYAFLWGLLTSLARLVSYVRFGPDFWMSLHRWGFEFLVRVPHFIAPLFVFIFSPKFKEEIHP